MSSFTAREGLTTTKAPFIEEAKNNNQLFIEQPYHLYSEENHKAWKDLFNEIHPLWRKYANKKFLEGIEILQLNATRIPKLEDVNQFLAPITGFEAKAVSGYVPAYQFFDCLRNRAFPTTITIRDQSLLNYLPEPDIFHDVAGHVPMHTDKVFADILVKFGSLAYRALSLHDHLDRDKKIEKIKNNIKALSRFFWFSIEFGLMKEGEELKVYGSGILSSSGEIQHSIESKEVQRLPFELKSVIHQPFEIDSYQPILFVIDSFESLYKEIDLLEEWLLTGKLDQVAEGKPIVNEEDFNLHLS